MTSKTINVLNENSIVKRIIFFIVGFLFALYANAQPDSLQTYFALPHDTTTGFGTADGKIATKQIGPPGGAIVSEDGRVELVFPEGALTATTNISIQPTTNPLSYGAGKAYLFEPSGIQFNKAVTVIFHYTKEEAETCPPELMGFCMQDQNGKWSSFEYEDWDSITRTLKGSIHHFCHYTDFKKLMIRPQKIEIRVNEIVDILVMDKGVIVDEGPYKGDFDMAKLREKTPFGWYINNIPGGDDKVGTIETFWFTMEKNQKAMYGKYHAPRYLPKGGFVDVKLANA